jgi:hypothetical protein
VQVPAEDGSSLTWAQFLSVDDPVSPQPTSPGVSDGDTLTTGLTFPAAGLHLLDTNASHDLILSPGSNLTADRTLTLTTGDADRTLTIGDSASVAGSNTGDQDLSGYSPTSHTHALSAITQSGATTGQVAAWNGSAWVPVTPSVDSLHPFLLGGM